MRTSTLVGAAVVVAVAAFGLGFSASYERGLDTAGVATPGVTTSSVVTVTTSNPPTSTDTAPVTSTPAQVTTPPPTSPPPTSPPPTSPPPTVDPPTSVPASMTVPATPPPSTAPPTSTPATLPGRLDATYPRDSQGRMLLLAGGAAAVIVQNIGGAPATFTVTGSGAVTVGATGTATGLLAPGEVRAVPLVASRNPPPGPGPHATVTVLGAEGLVASIPVVIT